VCCSVCDSVLQCSLQCVSHLNPKPPETPQQFVSQQLESLSSQLYSPFSNRTLSLLLRKFRDVCIYMSIRVYIRIYILGHGETICELCCSVLPARQAHQGSKSLRCPLLLQFLKSQLYSHLTQYTQYWADYLRIFAH